MSKSYKKSAKDIAFDKERAKFRHELSHAQSENKALQRQIADLQNQIYELNHNIKIKDKSMEALQAISQMEPRELQLAIKAYEFSKNMQSICDQLLKNPYF